MKTTAVCGECIKTNPVQARQAKDVPFYEDRIALVECRLGHQTAMVIQNSNTEILLSSAAEALFQGFTFEAVGSASAALERFYEFSLLVHFNFKGKTSQHFREFFKGMANQSERQLGAFMLFHELEFGTLFEPDQAMVSFRNGVIHKGRIPTPEKAEIYCGYVYDTLTAIRDRLIGKYGVDAVAKTVLEGVKDRMRLVPNGMTTSFANILSVFNVSSSAASPPFSNAMQSYAHARELMSQGLGNVL